MSFTRKHYEETARIVREQIEHVTPRRERATSAFEDGAIWASKVIGDRLSSMFAADNPRFDADRFAKACEPGSAK